MERRTQTILEVIDGGLEAAGEPADSDRVRVLQDEAWALLEAGVERGDYTMDIALGRYRAWHNTYCLGRMAAAGVQPEVVELHPPSPPDSAA